MADRHIINLIYAYSRSIGPIYINGPPEGLTYVHMSRSIVPFLSRRLRDRRFGYFDRNPATHKGWTPKIEESVVTKNFDVFCW